MQKDKRRIFVLDELRGFAILCMIVHHAFLDVGDVLNLQWGYDIFNSLCTVQPIFWAIFIIISGICSRLSRNTVKRGAIVFACAILITIVTAFIMPLFHFEKCEIFFGILHCLGLCMIITGLLIPLFKKIDYRVGAVISFALFCVLYGIDNGSICFGLVEMPANLYKTNLFAPLGFRTQSYFSADYFPLIPWLFMFFFGYFIGKAAYDERMPEFMYKKHSRLLCFTGKNSLWFYLAHQPVIYAIMLLLSLFIK